MVSTSSTGGTAVINPVTARQIAEVVDHYVNMADVELAAFDAHVTDWELARSFERM